jgi:hypothetical protein
VLLGVVLTARRVDRSCAQLRSSRAELEADIKHKTISYEQDQKCLKIGSADSLKKSSHNAFLRGEI